MTHYAMSLKGNSKTSCPTTTSAKETCPDTCPLKEKGCYAKYSFLGSYWKKLSNGEVKNSLDFQGLLKSIKKLPSGSIWRHNQAGDLCHNNGIIDRVKLDKLVKANKGKQGFTYTHHELSPENALTIDLANDQGFTINASTNNLQEADKVYNTYDSIPVVTLLPINAPKVSYTPKGNKVVKCPSDSKKGITCNTCKLCAIHDRDYIIGFEVHGSAKKSLDIIAKG
ncbi:MAG: hypothetical protein GWN01_15015 [Nitrosopumilaceae archaeon]|nr:hypothetical protein [Nitrosopumilaceae archaeon]NIU88562.1 hypothetical protein [Nitrosopumilaceae archaeon]NIV66780.1 hypothetical protein [Nitrosopumilaceae archaeon]NIX62760.1 hypothetical protein [Nitrosopumilaceae archaeon]